MIRIKEMVKDVALLGIFIDLKVSVILKECTKNRVTSVIQPDLIVVVFSIVS